MWPLTKLTKRLVSVIVISGFFKRLSIVIWTKPLFKRYPWTLNRIKLRGLYRENERGYKLKPKYLRRWTIHIIYLMFLSREIDIKLCKNYTKTYIYQILYKSCSVKHIIFNKYATNLKNDYIHEEPENLRFSTVIIFYFVFCILIDITDNIITCSLYRPYYVTRTSTNGSFQKQRHKI